MQLDDDTCRVRLGLSRHGVLATVHATRGVDALPVVYVMHNDHIVIPIDTIKPKSSARLQRLSNIDADNRVVLLVEHYDQDWSQLWWVRAHGRAREAEPKQDALAALANAHPAYQQAGTITNTIIVSVEHLSGWSAQAAFVM